MSWENVQKFFEDNPGGVLHRPDDQVYFMKLESKKDIVDPNEANAILVDAFMLGRGLVKGISKLAGKNIVKSTLSNNLKHHILSRHTLSGLRSQYGRAPLQKIISKTIFNPKWSDNKVLRASQKVIQQALKKGITNGTFTTTIYGETVTAVIENGVPKTVYGAFKVTEEILKL